MATILFAYEFGAGLGHIGMLGAVAKRFVGRHRLAFAVPDPASATPHLRRILGDGVAVRQAPRWSAVDEIVRERGTFCHTLADTLALFAFGDPHRLDACCETWSGIVEADKPDVMVADAAPTMRLALQGRIPMVVVGTGYTVLPGGRALPSLRPWQPHVPPSSRAVEARLCAAANDRRAVLNGAAIDGLGDLFRGDKTFVSTLPEFDPYADHRAADPYTPFAIPGHPPGPEFASRTGCPVFAYLPSVHPAALTVIEALNAIDAPSRLYLSNAHAEKVAELCRRHVRVHTEPADFSTVLPQCKVVIHHAGLGTVFAAAAAATPQLTLPAMLENQINGLGLKRGGSSIDMPIPPAPSAEQIVSNVHRLLIEGVFARKAAENADRLRRVAESDPLGQVTRAVESFAS